MRSVRLSDSLSRDDSIEQRTYRSAMLRKYQVQSGCKIEDIASAAGISVSLLYKIMSGTRQAKVGELRKILRAMSAPDIQPIINCISGRYSSLGKDSERLFDEVHGQIADRLRSDGINRHNVQPELAEPIMEYVAQRLSGFIERRCQIDYGTVGFSASDNWRDWRRTGLGSGRQIRHNRQETTARLTANGGSSEHSYCIVLDIYRRQTGTPVERLAECVSKSKTQIYEILAGNCQTSTGQIRAMLRCMGAPEVQPMINLMTGHTDLIGTPMEALLENITLGLEDYLIEANMDPDGMDLRTARAIVGLTSEAMQEFNQARRGLALDRARRGHERPKQAQGALGQ